jgi:Cu/Ag efflux protein CusF
MSDLIRIFVIGLMLSLTIQTVAHAKPNIFDLYEYENKVRAASETPQEHPWLRSKIKAIDRVRGQIRFTHVPAASLGMPAMTMTLGVSNGLDLSALGVSDTIDIRIAKQNGRIEIIEIRRQR